MCGLQSRQSKRRFIRNKLNVELEYTNALKGSTHLNWMAFIPNSSPFSLNHIHFLINLTTDGNTFFKKYMCDRLHF